MKVVQVGTNKANDDLSNYLKSNYKALDFGLFVEANSIHINDIKDCYSDYKNIFIENVAVKSPFQSGDELEIFYNTLDINGEISSCKYDHVYTHTIWCPKISSGEIKSFKVPCISLETLLDKYKISYLDWLLIDIEGIDAEVLLTFNWEKYQIKKIEFEHLHLGHYAHNMKSMLEGMGYEQVESLHEFDWAFENKNIKDPQKIKEFTICLHCGCSEDVVNSQMRALSPLEKKYKVYWNNRINRHPEIYDSYSKLINHSVATSPTEWIILINDRTVPTAEEVEKMIDLLEKGYACVLLYNVGFMGFSKELIRKIGWWDQRFAWAGWEDRDWVWRICMNNFAIYESEEATYDRSWKSPLYNSTEDATNHWYNKYHQYDDAIYKNLPEETYECWDKYIGESIPEISNSWNTWDKSDLDIMYNYDIENPLERSASSMLNGRKIVKNYE